MTDQMDGTVVPCRRGDGFGEPGGAPRQRGRGRRANEVDAGVDPRGREAGSENSPHVTEVREASEVREAEEPRDQIDM